jgi:hypothetical protein
VIPGLRASSDPTAEKPGNAGGAKGPYFGYVSEEGKKEVIDVESDNTQ